MAQGRGLERWMPGVGVLRRYERSWLPRDLIAGIVLVTLLVPQGMAYAELSGLPPITGLYTTVVCLVAYALVGPSPILVLGPDPHRGEDGAPQLRASDRFGQVGRDAGLAAPRRIAR